jgi:hypothetical protein
MRDISMANCSRISVLAAAVVLPALVAVHPARSGQDGHTARARPAVLPIVVFVPWRDPSEGAFALNVPHDWDIRGGTSRNASTDARHSVRAVSPDHSITIFIGDASLVPNQVPDPMMQTAGISEGRRILGPWGGPVLLARYKTGEQYARGYLARVSCGVSRTLNAQSLPQASRDLTAQAAGYGKVTGTWAVAWVGEATSQCGNEASYVRASTVLAAPATGAGAQVWDVLELSGYVATSQADETLARYVLDSMVASFQMDPQWLVQQAEALQDAGGAVTRAQQQMAAAIAEHARGEAGSIRIDVMSSWVKRSHRIAATVPRDSEARRAVNPVADPAHSGHAAADDYGYFWSRADGSIVATMAGTPPDRGNGWRMLSGR